MHRCSIAAADQVLVANARIAANAWERARGMLGRTFGYDLAALILDPCRAIHTWGMSGPIDVVFYDCEGAVVRIVEELRPMRSTACARARGVIELPPRRARGMGFAENLRIGFGDP